MRCRVCRHPEVALIDVQIAAGESLRDVAQRFGTTKSAVHRHAKARHLPAAPVRIDVSGYPVGIAEVLAEKRRVNVQLRAIADRALDKGGDLRVGLAAVQALSANVSDLAGLELRAEEIHAGKSAQAKVDALTERLAAELGVDVDELTAYATKVVQMKDGDPLPELTGTLAPKPAPTPPRTPVAWPQEPAESPTVEPEPRPAPEPETPAAAVTEPERIVPVGYIDEARRSLLETRRAREQREREERERTVRTVAMHHPGEEPPCDHTGHEPAHCPHPTRVVQVIEARPFTNAEMFMAGGPWPGWYQ